MVHDVSNCLTGAAAAERVEGITHGPRQEEACIADVDASYGKEVKGVPLQERM